MKSDAPSTARAKAADATPWLPARHSLTAMREAVQACQGCPLYLRATQAVFGEGPAKARLLIMGEVPGDKEDLAGHPFVGPAGRLLDEALEHAGLSRRNVYLTNAVKHFKWEPQGARRMHSRPSAREITACRPWWEAEVEAVHPETILCLGATAAQAVLGRSFRLTRQRGELLPSTYAAGILATYHPSAILRAPKPEQRQELRAAFFADVSRAAASLA
jgi:uracil-DNA glycosylase